MRSLPVLAAVLATLLAACGGDPAADLCDAVCECSGGCPDGARDECVTSIERARDAADQAGCGGEMDDYIECVTDESEAACDDPSLDGVCPSERDEVEECAGGVGASSDSTDPPPPDPGDTTRPAG